MWDWIKKKIQLYVVYRRHTLASKMQRVWKEKVYHVHTDHKRVRVAKLIVNKIDFKTKAITRYKEGYFIMIKEPIS